MSLSLHSLRNSDLRQKTLWARDQMNKQEHGSEMYRHYQRLFRALCAQYRAKSSLAEQTEKTKSVFIKSQAMRKHNKTYWTLDMSGDNTEPTLWQYLRTYKWYFIFLVVGLFLGEYAVDTILSFFNL